MIPPDANPYYQPPQRNVIQVDRKDGTWIVWNWNDLCWDLKYEKLDLPTDPTSALQMGEDLR